MSEGLIILDTNNVVEDANPAARKMLSLEAQDGLDIITKAMDKLGLRNMVNQAGDQTGECETGRDNRVCGH